MNAAQIELVRNDCARVLSDAVSTLEPLRNKCLVVTGGTGFMGTWLTEMVLFLNEQHDFRTQIVLISEHASNLKARAPHLTRSKQVRIVDQDVRSIIELPSDASWVVHAAANPDNRIHTSDPVRTIDVIVNGTKMVLAAATRLTDLEGFLNISSGLVYGSQPWDLPALPETYCGTLNCNNAAASYAEAKRLAETLCAAYRNEHRIPIISARPFTFIGPMQSLERPWAANNCLRDGLLGGPIRILGDGETVRGHMYAADMAYWILRILVSGRSGQSYNVGSPHGIKLKDLAVKIANQFPVPPKIEFSAAKGAKPASSILVPDVTLATKDCGVRLNTDIDLAIRQTLAWHRST